MELLRGEYPLGEVMHLPEIHMALRIHFPDDRQSAYRWVRTPNRRFGGKSALDVMEEQGFIGAAMVRLYLDLDYGR